MNPSGALPFATVVVLTVAVHFVFIGYLVIGGFLAWRWPSTIAIHVPAVLWGAAGVALGLPCPLTDLERWARAGAGMGPLPPEGFIDYYLTGVWYPTGFAAGVQMLVFAAVLGSWAALSIRSRTRSAGSQAR